MRDSGGSSNSSSSSRGSRSRGDARGEGQQPRGSAPAAAQPGPREPQGASLGCSVLRPHPFRARHPTQRGCIYHHGKSRGGGLTH